MRLDDGLKVSDWARPLVRHRWTTRGKRQSAKKMPRVEVEEAMYR
jgi:hypothetical protein